MASVPNYKEQQTGRHVLAQEPKLVAGVGAGVAGAAAVETAGAVHRTVLTLTDIEVTMAGDGSTGKVGGAKVYDFPDGNIAVLGCVADLVVTSAAEITDWNGKLGIGSAAATAGEDTLTGTEADLIASTAFTATGNVGAAQGLSTSSEKAVLDGTTTAAKAHVNLHCDDAATTLTVSGTLEIVWVDLGTLS